MASSSVASILDCSAEKANGFKLMRLIVDGGTEALRKLFLKIHPGSLQVVLSLHHTTLSKLRNKVLNQHQWDKLYPAPPIQPDINDFDITLLCVLLRSICGLSPPSTGWNYMPNVTDNSDVANMIRIKMFRNECFGHIPNSSVRLADFVAYWNEVSPVLVALGISQDEIDRLKDEKCGKEEVDRVWTLWNESEGMVLQRLDEHGKYLIEIKEKLDKLMSHSDCVIDKQLACCDFRTEINLLHDKFVEGTREWVFEEIAAWFDNEASGNRAFVITASAGMGKSVVAAVVCKRFAEHLGGCHFCQYNNDHYNSPKVLLQSLARQLSTVFPEYTKALNDKISGNLGQGLNSMNVDGLFSVLFKEPLEKIDRIGRQLLIVIDAVDEGEFNGRLELANLFANQLYKLPTGIRFLITTRPEKNIIDKLQKFNPLFIELDDARNLNDIKLFFHDKYSAGWIHDLKTMKMLAEKCNGLMILAFFLAELSKNSLSGVSADCLPPGIGDYYRMCFERLEHDLNLLKVGEDAFLNLMSMLVVAKEPLPCAFVEKLFGIDSTSPSKRRTVMNAIKSLSTLFILSPKETLFFSHKSVKDWLVTNLKSVFAVDENSGHKILGDMCRDVLATWKRNGSKMSPVRYALKYSLKHLLNVPEQQSLNLFVKDLILDLQIMCLSVCVINVDDTIANIACLRKHEAYSHFPQDIKKTVKAFDLLLRKSRNILMRPQSFFQAVINQGGSELSSKASSLLRTVGKDLYCLEFVNKNKIRAPCETCCSLSDVIYSVDVSSEGDYVVCAYEDGELELFSLETGMSMWLLPCLSPSRFVNCFRLPHYTVFHPCKNIILPGQLNQVVNFQGSFEPGPFHCEEGEAKFSDCCFSKVSGRMVTTYEKNLFVWDVSSGQKIRSIALTSPLVSLSFTASGKFLGTTNDLNEFQVYAVDEDFRVSRKVYTCEDTVEIISTFESDSWLLALDMNLFTTNFHVSSSDVRPLSFLSRICGVVIPCNFDAAEELYNNLVNLVNFEISLFRIVRKFVPLNLNVLGCHFFAVHKENIIVFSPSVDRLYVLNRKKLVNFEVRPDNNKLVETKISVSGDFVYSNDKESLKFTAFHINTGCLFTKTDHSVRNRFYSTVRNGVFLEGKNNIPELWTCNLSQCMTFFDTLAGTTGCYSVSDEFVACLCGNFLYFLNVISGEVGSEIPVDKEDEEVLACSSKYHVLVSTKGGRRSVLWKDGVKIDNWVDLCNKCPVLDLAILADFSPEGDFLAVCSMFSNCVYTIDVNSFGWPKLVLMVFDDRYLCCKFFTNELLLCSTKNLRLYLINAAFGVLAYVDTEIVPLSLSVSRDQSIVLIGDDDSEEYDLIKVWLPR